LLNQKLANTKISSKKKHVNLPNKITVSRFVLAVLFLVVLLIPGRPYQTLALVAFILAAYTDYIDGKLARKHGLVSNFGILMDPLADKVLICSAFIALIEKHIHAILTGTLPVALQIGDYAIYPRVHAWMAVVIVTRELAVTGLRLLAAAKHMILPAERFGKHKTAAQILAIVCLLTLNAAAEWPAPLTAFLLKWLPFIALLALWIAILLTAITGVIYLWRYRHLYMHGC